MPFLAAGVRSKATPYAVPSLKIIEFNLPKSFSALNMRYFSSKQPPQENSSETNKNQQGNPTNTSGKCEVEISQSRFKNSRKKEWKANNYAGNHTRTLIQPSPYLYDPRKPRVVEDNASASFPYLTLRSIDASALLDPFSFCKESAKTTHTHGVNRSISGTDAARRLLRGKKDFLLAARGVRTPLLLEGHGVPPQLFQHCIDMADALLYQYGKDIVACTFHNYHESNDILPQVVRTRSIDAKNRCSSWPPLEPFVHDWDYHLGLYLTVMKRLACNLAMVLQVKNVGGAYNEDEENNGFISSPLLFASAPPSPQWNVDVLRGACYDLKHTGRVPRSQIPVLPIIEFPRGSGSVGHVLVRLQGFPQPNPAFQLEFSRGPVTLVFDACFRA